MIWKEKTGQREDRYNFAYIFGTIVTVKPYCHWTTNLCFFSSHDEENSLSSAKIWNNMKKLKYVLKNHTILNINVEWISNKLPHEILFVFPID